MNLLLLLLGLRPWAAPPLGAFARTVGAIACLSVEMQVVTWTGLGSLTTLTGLNAALAALLLYLGRAAPRALDARPAGAAPPPPAARAGRLPWVAVGLMALLAVVLDTARPLEGADPYHLERVAQIVRLGSLEFDTTADVKVNVLTSSYELVLADLQQVPVAGPALVRLHGLLGLAFFALGIAAVRTWLTGGAPWSWSAVFVVPVVFHQLVLVKNDLYSATPALVALGWLVTRAPAAAPREVAWASALVGLAVGMKWVSFPLAIVAVGTLVACDRRGWRALAAMVVGGALGGIAGGLPFTVAEAARWYGPGLEPLAALGNRTLTLGDSVTSVVRFGISLVDFGVVTRAWWPGRGGWGATFGAPLVWAAVVLLWRGGRPPGAQADVRRALWMAAVYFTVFAAVYPDADVAHRLVLAPGLLLIAMAARDTSGDAARARWARRTLAAALAISGIQIARSAALYLSAR